MKKYYASKEKELNTTNTHVLWVSSSSSFSKKIRVRVLNERIIDTMISCAYLLTQLFEQFVFHSILSPVKKDTYLNHKIIAKWFLRCKTSSERLTVLNRKLLNKISYLNKNKILYTVSVCMIVRFNKCTIKSDISKEWKKTKDLPAYSI